MDNPIHIGTSGWSYADWVGPFYPRGAGKEHFLGLYAEQFDLVEVDSTYYRPPSRRMVENWAARTPDHFRFTLKVPSEITHERVLLDCEPEMESYLDVLEPLRPKIRSLLLQFGYFNRSAFRTPRPFFQRLDAFLREFAPKIPIAVEIRNKNWLSDEYFDLLRAHNISSTIVEHVWMPPIDEVIAKHDVATGPLLYCRLIGDRDDIEQITKSWGRVVVDRGRDIARVARTLRHAAERTEILVFANNHYAGHGPATVRELRKAIETPELV